MKTIVQSHVIKIEKDEIVNKNEYNINKCYFQFSEEYTDNLVKVALFTKDNKSYKQIIINNECSIPNEILISKGTCILGVYAYKEENGELILRYSPTPKKFVIDEGSYIENAENSIPITPSELEQYQQALNNGLNKLDSTIDEFNRRMDNGEFIGPIGPTGKDGYTPVKGKDYFTEDDIESLISENNIVTDPKYVHTNNNYTDEDKDKLDGLSNYDDTSIKEEISNIEKNKADKTEIPDISNLVDEQSLTEALKTKQDTLKLGENIVIKDGVISAKEKTWKKVRTITIPSDDYKGQEIDGVKYDYSVSSNGGIKSITFSTTEDGEPLSEHNITGAIIRLTPTENININQGFVSINSNGLSASAGYALDYILNIKATTTLRWFEYSLHPYLATMITDNPGRYRFPAQYTHKQINDFNFGGFEAASVLGEGTKFEIWMYGYWD